jgi:DNA mismatch repair protein MutS2
MNKKALQVLEYKKIAELLKNETQCELSAKKAEALKPGGDIRDIREETRSTTEAVDLIVHKGSLPIGGIYDVSRDVKFAKKGGTLTPKQLLQVKYDLQTAGSTVTFMKGDDVPDAPHIKELTELIEPHRDLAKAIDKCILSEDEIADDASPELRRIRRDIAAQNDAVRSKLAQMTASSDNKDFLQDAIVTMRDGRYVIPVKTEYHSKFPGIVHDQSRGGSTLFIEPEVIVNMNNKLKELKLAEEAEIARILGELSGKAGECAGDIIRNQQLLAELDFIMAKGRLSLDMDGEEPKLTEDGPLVLKSARHPLLDKDKAVPISVTLGDTYRTLVITGPNTGGKTVTLKTIGLLSLMALSGLHIPASSESVIPVYKDIFADIGDEQSIEQNLSTFSAHMKNIVFITNHAEPGTLVLADELGAGTDPTEGAALAIAVLERLYELGACTAATTHYNELKKYAISTEGVENASMEFDVDTLSPTYHLLIGVPGKSNAFDISRKLGLQRVIIKRARSLIEQGDMEFEEVITAIDKDRHQAEADRAESARMAAEMREKYDKAEKESEELSKNKEKILAEARRQAREILRDARETADEVRKDLNAMDKNMSVAEKNRAFSEANRKLNDKSRKYQERMVRQINNKPVDIASLKKGDMVKVLSLGQNGEIASVENGGIQVRLGSVKMTVKPSDIAMVTDGSKQSVKRQREMQRVTSGIARHKAMTVSPQTDVRGESLDDALIEVDKYIDDAFIAGLSEVTIIHGRGTGVLKDGIRRNLSKNRHVKSFRPGAYDEGGEGVTIAALKK